MRRMAFVLLCLLALGFGSCRRESPPGPDNGTIGVETPTDSGQADDLDAALMALVPETLAELDRPLDASRALEYLKGTILASPAAELLGQQEIDNLVAAIDEFQKELSTSGSPRQLAALANPAPRRDDDNNIQVQKSFDDEDFHTDMSVSMSLEEKGDRVVIDGKVSIHFQGISPDKIGQEMDVEITYQSDQNACPTAEGETAGTFSSTSYMSIIGDMDGSFETFTRTVTGQISMEADNTDDGTLDQAELSFEGSINYNISGQTWGTSFTSQASGVNPKDNASILAQLMANKQGDASPPPASSKIKTENYSEAILAAIKFPLVTLVPGNKFAENLWQTDNRCVEFKVTPEEVRLKPGDSEDVEVELTLKADGGSISAEINAETSGAGGQIDPEQANSSSGAAANFTYTAPDDGPPGSFSLDATTKAGIAHKVVQVKAPKIEWSGTFTMAGSSTIQDVGSSQGTTTFTIRFQADLNQSGSDTGEHVKVPFDLESDASMSWSGTAKALGQSQSFSGSTSNIITPNYANPEWFVALPDGDCLGGEGFVDLTEKKLYLLLFGIGDKTGYGTFNLSPNTTCSYYLDQMTNRVYLVFPLDDEFKIADGSCSDKVSADTGGEGSMTVQSTRSWHFDARYVSDEQAGP